ncbi:MAG: hypothetical protein E6Q57_03670 [Mycobacterium sp.]|nr:MAG: hypothetical protein E6Q57_03670 [Mycobacterium sp.]
MNSHPCVHDSAVVGAPDERRGERIQAFVVAEPGSTLQFEDLDRFLIQRLARFKVPADYEFIDTIPRNPSGKILRRELRERFWVGRDRQIS